jgi:predicted nucleic acid-binding protein
VNPGLPSTHLRRYVLDANALISFLEGRPAAPKVRRLLEEVEQSDLPLLLSAVNWGEVFYVSWRLHGEGLARAIESKLRRLPILVMAADQERATRAAALKQKHNLSYADSFAAELAIDYKAWLVTADPEFVKLGKALSIYSLPRYKKE